MVQPNEIPRRTASFAARWAATAAAATTATAVVSATVVVFGDHTRQAAAEPTLAATPSVCRFVHGFAQFRNDLGDLIGDCREDEWSDPATGDSRQRTSRGLLHWRRADNLVAFTDGSRTWVRARDGAIHIRPNYERFAWESAPGCIVTAETRRR